MLANQTAIARIPRRVSDRCRSIECLDAIFAHLAPMANVCSTCYRSPVNDGSNLTKNVYD